MAASRNFNNFYERDEFLAPSEYLPWIQRFHNNLIPNVMFANLLMDLHFGECMFSGRNLNNPCALFATKQR